MALRDWISHPGRVATATVATLATLNPEKQRTVATVATVSVARVEKKGKSSTIETVPALPRWCRANCPGLETIPLAKEGDVAGCVNPVNGTWRRLAWMGQCPATEALVSKAEVSKMVSIKQVATERQTVEANALSEWCGTACEHFHQAEAEYCCREIDETHWRRDRIDTMKSCPRIGRI